MKAYDTKRLTWRHLNFFEYEAYLHADAPRVQCSADCGIRRIEVPWARTGSGFTLPFEAMVIRQAKAMPVAELAEQLGVHDTKLWRVLHYHVDLARSRVDHSNVTRAGVDETVARRGHDYVTFFFDLDEKRLIFATEGKDQNTVKAFKDHLECHHGDASSIKQFCCDMSPAFISGVKKQFPNAQITFDRFHVTKLLNDAVDEVRRDEVKYRKELKKTRYDWLKNPENLTAKQKERLSRLSQKNLKTARAYHIRLNFQEFFAQPNRETGEVFLKRWYFWATHSRLPPMIKAAKTIKQHWEGVLNWFDGHITNAILAGMNSLVQAAKSRARGYRTKRNMITIAYLIGGRLEFDLPT